ncbi:hypothetical protein [Leptospira kanakyensis]|uniref:hypothetical protein n=1 Tax=Leptospira kanakyensis TaxID=2484968 RepID=UPI00223D3DD3|nr:hypothetical protein [Leptospira kanakyensis]MCW7469128.1 hypothetical protein [Leptospira kanakyensis]MCW7480117.1 hypothetical protein [Leptospira kanakyensis]
MKNRLVHLILVLSFFVNCYAFDSFESRDEKEKKKSDKKFESICISMMALYFSSCSDSNKPRNLCSDMYLQCLYVCGAQTSLPGCGF